MGLARVNPETAVDAAKLAPPAAVTMFSLFGIPLEQWVYILTIVYTVLLIVRHLWLYWIRPLLPGRDE